MFSGPLEDRVAISELNGTYADGVVRADAETWGTVWAEEAHWNLMGMAVDGKDAIVTMWKGAMGGLEAVSFHCVPCMIEVTGDTARSRVQTQEYMLTKEGKTRAIGGLYEDELVKRDGRWLFSSRTFRIVAEYNPQGD
ncbi:nuclear transport factor 2 family protein [Novosphingobium sp.]|uniref:nuclear transport factor 2 family protein n=1 Tax=Novosphingobium sp. TaxID=1874826 RepID=UPI0025F35281|nr:nuclear transport factor 2 family protein [Novosphingobium sp.]